MHKHNIAVLILLMMLLFGVVKAIRTPVERFSCRDVMVGIGHIWEGNGTASHIRWWDGSSEEDDKYDRGPCIKNSGIRWNPGPLAFR